jgi:hypothetical protein
LRLPFDSAQLLIKVLGISPGKLRNAGDPEQLEIA